MNTQKLITTALTLATGLVATRAIAFAWKGVTGHEPPQAFDDDTEISVAEVVVFAAVSGAVAAFLRAYVTRGTAKWLGPTDIPKR